MFSWRPIHEETAARLLEFESRQKDLIALLREMADAGLNVVPLSDHPREGEDGPLQEIDPMTFMAVFNRPITPAKKIANWRFVKKAWGLKSDVPSDFHGIPTISPQNAWFFGWAYRRSPQDIPDLWALARYAIGGRWSEVPNQLFTECLDIHAVGLGKLTTGLFWLAPTQILPLPSTTTGYLESKGITTDVKDKTSYEEVLERVRREISSDLIQVSHDAWMHSTANEPFVLTEKDADRIWSVFKAAMPDFVDFANPGQTFLEQEIQYKRSGLKKFEEAGGRAAIERKLAENNATEALRILQRTVALNIASFQSWRPSMGEGNPEALADALGALVKVTDRPYSGLGTLLPVFDAMQRHGLTPAWDTLSVVLWALRPSDYFPIKISYYRKLAESLGRDLVSGRPSPQSFHTVMSFARAFWDVAKRASPVDWVDAQSFIWVLCSNSDRLAGVEPEGAPDLRTRPRMIWTIAPGERARLWEDFFQQGIVGIGWDYLGNLGDLNRYPSKDAVEQAIRDHDKSEGRRSNDALACWEFAHVMAPGDVVLAKKGREQVTGVGIVKGKYRFAPDREEYTHVRDVEWTHQGVWHVESQFALKTLTDATLYRDFVKSILRTVGADRLLTELYGAEPETQAKEDQPISAIRSGAEPFTEASALADLFMDRDRLAEMMRQLGRKQNIVLQGPPGVGKTFAARRLAYLLLGEKDDSRIETVQFHPSTSYEDFVLGLRPDGRGGFSLKPGVFHRFCEKARDDVQERPHVFIIDEINRGNLAKIFGELLMLVESDKRGPEHAITLTYEEKSAPRFYLPRNLYLIGTMNTADRSLALVDYALRRRFAFIGLTPTFNERFRASLHARGCPKDFVGQLCERIGSLNAQISADTRSLGPGYQIGHSYFCDGGKITDPVAWLTDIVRFEIQPLLEEYWMDDLKKADEETAKLIT